MTPKRNAHLGESLRVSTKAIVGVVAVPAVMVVLAAVWPSALPIGTRSLLRVVLPGFVVLAAAFGWLVSRFRERERELAEFVDALPVLAAKLAPDGTVLLRNEAAARAAGRGCPEAIGKRFWELPHGNPERFREAVARAVALGEDRFEDAPRDPDGRSYEVTVRAVRHGGEVAYLVAEGHDVTDRKRVEESLRRSEARYRTLTEAARDLIFIVRADRVLAFANDAVAARLGRPVAELIGRTVDETFPPASGAAFDPLVRRAQERGGPVRAEGPVPRPSGTGTVWYETLAERLGDEDGVPAVLCIARDVTERKEMEARFLASDRMASVGVLAAGVAHEINNPLSYVLANLDVLADELRTRGACLSEEVRRELRETIEEAHEGAWRVRAIVKDLQTFSREDEEAAGNVDVHAALEKSLRMAGNLVRQRARLTKVYGTVPEVHANEARLGQVFLNLIVNGVQAMDEGHPADNELRITTRADGGRVVVEIADTGQGIPAANLPLIFQPFFTTKPLGQGTGLGLSICQNIVRALGGEIVVESEVGRGATFRVVLPASPGA